MRFYKPFLMGVILLLSFNQKVLAMEEGHPDSHSILRTESLPDLPVEIQAHILSFLDHQEDLLRAGGISKTWRQTAEMVWNNKPLNLSKRQLTKVDYKALVQGPFSFLVLQSVKLGAKEANILASSCRFIHLDLSTNSLGDEGAAKIASANFPLLADLDLRGNSIGVKGAEKIASANFPLLADLDLRGNSIGVKGAEKIALANFPLLTALDLSYNSIEDEGAEKIALANFPLLTALDLSYNSIEDEGAGKIASANFPLLTTLDLSYNSIGDEGAGKIASANFPLLTSLNLTSNSIGDEGAGKIASANFPLLTTLDLSYNSIAVKGLEAFKKNVRLKVMN